MHRTEDAIVAVAFHNYRLVFTIHLALGGLLAIPIKRHGLRRSATNRN